ARQDQHVEPFVRLHEGVDQPHRVRRVNVVVHVPVNQQQVSLQVGRQLGISRDVNLELQLRRIFLLRLGLLVNLLGLILLVIILLRLILLGVVLLRLGLLLVGLYVLLRFHFLVVPLGFNLLILRVVVLVVRFAGWNLGGLLGLDRHFLQPVVALGPVVVVNVV